jgi:predicted metal-binding membrane protein
MVAQRADRLLLLGLVVAGYLAAWGVFGIAAHLADLALAAAVRQSAWATFNGWAIGAAVVLVAGLFQFSTLKHRCLQSCHGPLAQVAGHWHGRAPRREAFWLGLAHGAYCVGCCWALMLLMFVVGTGNLGWMLALGLVMAAEKNLTWGRRLSAPVGIGLIAWFAAIVGTHV